MKDFTFNEYSKAACKTNVCPALSGDAGALPLYESLGLVGEAGEAAEKVKKAWRDGVFDLLGYVTELGDTLWYLSQAAAKVGFTLEEVALINLNKLEDRHNRGVIHGEGDKR